MASISISCPSCSATEGVVRNGKSTAGHQRYLCSHCRKTWQLQFTYTASQPGTHQKIIDMAMNGVGCRATARIMGVGLNTISNYLDNFSLFSMAYSWGGYESLILANQPEHIAAIRPQGEIDFSGTLIRLHISIPLI